jgi:hypothetical protein
MNMKLEPRPAKKMQIERQAGPAEPRSDTVQSLRRALGPLKRPAGRGVTAFITLVHCA